MPFMTAFSSDSENLVVADRLRCIVRAVKVETFSSGTKNTGCCFYSVYRKQVLFFADPANQKKKNLYLIIFFSIKCGIWGYFLPNLHLQFDDNWILLPINGYLLIICNKYISSGSHNNKILKYVGKMFANYTLDKSPYYFVKIN